MMVSSLLRSCAAAAITHALSVFSTSCILLPQGSPFVGGAYMIRVRQAVLRRHPYSQLIRQEVSRMLRRGRSMTSGEVRIPFRDAPWAINTSHFGNSGSVWIPRSADPMQTPTLEANTRMQAKFRPCRLDLELGL
jgi:hypothetical protein